jgi:hypothetical protein
MCLEYFRGDIITGATRDTTVLWRYKTRTWDERCGRTKVDKLNVRSARDYEVVGFDIAAGCSERRRGRQ